MRSEIYENLMCAWQDHLTKLPKMMIQANKNAERRKNILKKGRTGLFSKENDKNILKNG